ncbi:MAG: hypothetical protein UX94_C0005G0074 [Parcubacteria group bacterium GW2011_GWA2_47_21]|uniref:Carbonic anhydrase n=1 Tax=Candidatus Yanofskybacteria bacterium GW2011_GWC2_41_9 TaxID=1619029 RepID=A0A0G0ZSD7_9BACT|nr:MAG: hypothetical protein UU84_C0052G0003 [Candidatus Yanofskybacteria bacterium GW2011_GWC2_41_9]KKU70512.1 MAG: hypothetical protein UX94_C0005G0074 [Parcubacteria group bacterium GW2011_GWA2_47_21]
MQLKENDLTLIRKLRAENILEDVAAHQINGAPNGILMCADGHQTPDVLRRHAEFIQRADTKECCCHSLMLNGGALLLSEELTSDYSYPIGQMILDQFAQAIELKGIGTVVLYIHTPCGMAKKWGLSFEKMLDRLFEAKMRVRRHFRDNRLKLVCFCQVDYGDRKLTYFISRKKWGAWKHTNLV